MLNWPMFASNVLIGKKDKKKNTLDETEDTCAMFLMSCIKNILSLAVRFSENKIPLFAISS